MGERSGGMVKTKYKYIKFDYQPMSGKWLITNHRYNEHIGLISYDKKWKEWELVPFEDTGWTIECLEDVIHFIKQLNSQETHQ